MYTFECLYKICRFIYLYQTEKMFFTQNSTLVFTESLLFKLSRLLWTRATYECPNVQ